MPEGLCSLNRPLCVGAFAEFLSLFLVPEEQLSQWLHFANSVFNRLEDVAIVGRIC